MKILLAGGGTLGSVTPLLALRDYLEQVEKGRHNFIFVGTAAGPEKELVKSEGVVFFSIRAAKLDRFFTWRLLLAPLVFIWSLLESAWILSRTKPEVIVSAGGYVAVPLVYIGRFLALPAVLHQSDIRSGLANRLMARWARTISVSVPEAGTAFPEELVTVTGIPVRRAIHRVLESRAELQSGAERLFGLEQNFPTLLIMGGGTGAEQINRLARASAWELAGAANVIHLTGRGKKGADFVHRRYKCFEMLSGEELAYSYACADFVVSRAGMGAIAELSLLEKPFLLIPLPDSPQEENARYFAQRAGIPVLGKDTGANKFARVVGGYLRDPRSWPGSIEKMRRLLPANGAARLSALIKESVNG